MATPIASNDLPPVPNAYNILSDFDSKVMGDKVTVSLTNQVWIKWFMDLRTKVNIIDNSIISIGNITTSGTVVTDGNGNFSAVHLTPGTYGDNSHVAQVTVGPGGDITNISNVSITGAGSPLTTKGDLYTFSTANTRLPVGPDGSVLIADSTQTTGLRWGANTPTLPWTTLGDVLVYGPSGPARLPVGTNGQVLTSRSTATNGVDWETPAASSPLTTKGDIYGFSTANARIPVGTNGQVFTADSTNANGVSWQTLSSGPTLAAAILADTPMGFWKCTDASGGFADSSGNGFNMTTVNGTVTFQGTPLIPSSPSDLCAIVGGLNGASGANGCRLTSQLGLTFPLTNWTAEGIFIPYVNSSGNVVLFDLRPSGSSMTAVTLLWVANGTGGGSFQAFYPGTTNSLTVTYGTIGRKMHVAYRCSTVGTTSTLSVFCNGTQMISVTATASTLTGTMIANIGAVTGINTNSFGVGYVAVFNTALTSTRIAAHASAAGLMG